MKKITKICLSVLLILCFSIHISDRTVQAAYLDLNAQSAILIEETSGKILYGKEERLRMYPASTTKILTALLALEYLKPTEIVTAGDEVNAVPFGSSLAGHFKGESLLVENLIRGLIIPSGNETACIVAKAVAKKVKNTDSMSYDQAEMIFSDLMNQKAAELGANDSHFVNPHGYHDDNHYTTAFDMALIAQAAMQNSLIREVVAEISFSGNGAGENHDPSLKTKNHNWVSHNGLLNDPKYSYPYATGIKTGLTDEAGYCLTASAEKDGKKLISVVFHSTEAGRWEDTKKLFEFGFSYFNYETVLKKGEVVEKVLLSNPRLGESKTLEIYAVQEFVDFVSADDLIRLQSGYRIEYDEAYLADKREDDDDILLQAPIEKDAVIGKIIYTLENQMVFEGDLLASRDVDKRNLRSDLDYYADQAKKNAFTLKALPFWAGVVVFLGCVVAFLRFRARKKNRNFYRMNKRY